MMSKRAQTTMTGVFIAIIITLGLFYGMFEYTQSNYESSGITESAGYNESYYELQTSQANLDTQITKIQNATAGITEANSNYALVAWNGLKGLAAAIRLFVGVIDTGVNVFDAILPALRFFPTWVKTLLNLAILITLILIVIGAFKGETKT